MARTTAAHGYAAGNDRCAHCNTKAEATVSGPHATTGEPVSLRVCLSCVTRYLPVASSVPSRRPRVVPTITPDPEANVALCACNRFVGHNGRAAHRCTAA